MFCAARRIIRAIVYSCLCISMLVSRSVPAYAANSTAIEQQINLIDQEYSTTATSASPTDNSLGLIYWDENNYNNETVYFEAVIYCASCSGGNQQAVAELYNDAGTLVTSSAATSTQSTYTRVRSSDITSSITDDDEYTVRLRVDASSGTAYIQAARLIVIQNHTAITDTETQIEIGNADTTTATSYELMTGPKIYAYDYHSTSDRSGIYFEATLAGSDATATSYAALSSSSNCSTTVTGSELSSTGTSWSRQRSADLSAVMIDDTEYWVCLKTTSADTGSIANGKVIIDQTSITSISAIELFHQYINTPHTDADSTYTSQLFDNEYNPANFVSDLQEYYFEATMQTSAGTAFARLYNVTDAINITNAERTSTATGYERVRSPNIADTLPSTTKTIDTQLRNAASNTTTASSSWLIIKLQEEASLSFTISAVAKDQVHNEITTSVASTFNTLPFDSLTFNAPKYAAHELYVKTNSTYGYIVQVKLDGFLQGIYPGNNIDPFVAPWSTPTTWTEPTGTTPSSDTAWIGANTSDTRVTNWTTGTAQKFGALDSTLQTIMQSNGSDAGTTEYFTVAIGANINQPSDLYSTSMIYQIIPTY